jgi:hypothetical protein
MGFSSSFKHFITLTNSPVFPSFLSGPQADVMADEKEQISFLSFRSFPVTKR